MAKELPYFRFTVSEWLNDDISIEDYRVQGVFASVCAYYWFQDCSITKAKLEKRFNDAKAEIESLLNLGIIKELDDDFISIKFLDEQYDLLSEKRKKRVEAGRKGGKAKASNAKAMPKQSSSYKDKDKDNNKDKDKSSTSTPPDLEEVIIYFNEKGFSEELAEKFFNYYDEPMQDRNGRVWKDQNGKTVKSWKQKAISVWLKKDKSNGYEKGSIEHGKSVSERVDRIFAN